jgi:hypothetical protein
MNQSFTDFDPLNLEVVPGTKVRDLPSPEACASALLRIEMDMESINAQIAAAEASPKLAAPGWRTKAQSALRWKKRIYKAVQAFAKTFDATPSPTTVKRKLILDTVRDELGDAEFDRLVAIAIDKHPEVFAESNPVASHAHAREGRL